MRLRKSSLIKSMFALAAAMLLLFVFASAASAEDEKKGPKVKDVDEIEPGVVASYGQHKQAAAVEMSADEPAAGGELSPVRASIKRIKRGKCEAVVTNQSKKATYSVSYDVVGSREGTAPSFRRGYSATVKPQQTVVRNVSCRSNLNLQIVLKSGTRLKSSKEKSEEAAAQAK